MKKILLVISIMVFAVILSSSVGERKSDTNLNLKYEKILDYKDKIDAKIASESVYVPEMGRKLAKVTPELGSMISTFQALYEDYILELEKVKGPNVSPTPSMVELGWCWICHCLQCDHWLPQGCKIYCSCYFTCPICGCTWTIGDPFMHECWEQWVGDCGECSL